jgi:Rrf2 family protein
LLVKPPAEVKLTEVVQLLEGSIAPVDCVNDPRVCSRSVSCVTRDIWMQIKDAMIQVLDSTTLQDLVERQRQKEQTETGMYHI